MEASNMASIIPDLIFSYFLFIIFWDFVIYAGNKNSITPLGDDEKWLDLITIILNGIFFGILFYINKYV